MNNQQTHKSDADAIKDILLAPVRARIQTSDIRAGMLSSTGLNEKVADLTMLVQQARQQEREYVVAELSRELGRWWIPGWILGKNITNPNNTV